MDYMARNEEHYSNFIVASSDEEDSKSSVKDPNVTPFQAYVARKRRDGIHGNHAEIQAISELFNRPVEVYTPDNPDGKPMNIFHSEYKTSDPPIRLSYHDGNHYNAIVDPLVPTAGLGLGLPGLQPGLADKLQLAKAKAESDQLADDMELQRVLKESQEEYKDFQQDSLQRALKDSSYDLDYVSRTRRLRTTISLPMSKLVHFLSFRFTSRKRWRCQIWMKRTTKSNKKFWLTQSNHIFDKNSVENRERLLVDLIKIVGGEARVQTQPSLLLQQADAPVWIVPVRMQPYPRLPPLRQLLFPLQRRQPHLRNRLEWLLPVPVSQQGKNTHKQSKSW